MTTEIPFVRDMTPMYDEPQRVSPLVRRVLARNPGPFTFLGSETYILGNGQVAVVDPGPDDPIHTDAILGALDPGESISHIFVTHHHLDHVGGVALLQERTEAPTLGFGWDAPSFKIESPLFIFGDPEADGADLSSTNSEGEGEGEGEGDKSFQPDVVLTDGDVVAMDHGTLEIIHTPGHASDHLCYSYPQEQLLLTGDHVMGWSTSVIPPPDGELNAYVASLTLLLDRNDRWYLPTHGPAVMEPKTFVKALLEHRRERSQQILGVLSEGPHSVVEIVPRIYGNIPKQLWSGAAASVWAHILALAHTGEVVPTEGELTSTSYIYRCS